MFNIWHIQIYPSIYLFIYLFCTAAFSLQKEKQNAIEGVMLSSESYYFWHVIIPQWGIRVSGTLRSLSSTNVERVLMDQIKCLSLPVSFPPQGQTIRGLWEANEQPTSSITHAY